MYRPVEATFRGSTANGTFSLLLQEQQEGKKTYRLEDRRYNEETFINSI
jgi:hypothetical protein